MSINEPDRGCKKILQNGEYAVIGLGHVLFSGYEVRQRSRCVDESEDPPKKRHGNWFCSGVF